MRRYSNLCNTTLLPSYSTAKPTVLYCKLATASSMYRRSQTSGSVDARLNISDDGLGRSWDTASRFRLQEAGLAIGAAHRDALFRVQVELGLHELTAALSSLRWKVARSMITEGVLLVRPMLEMQSSHLCAISSHRPLQRYLHKLFELLIAVLLLQRGV